MSDARLEITPDRNAVGMTAESITALRYDHHVDDPVEVGGLIRDMMPHHSRVLDVGCGTGSLTQIINHGKFNQVIAIEPDCTRAEAARSLGLDVRKGELDEDFAAENGPFDVIVFADVLEHLPAPAEVLATATAALKPGGMIIASVPNVAHWSVRLALLFGRFNYADVGIMDATHLRWFTAVTFRRLIEASGLKIVAERQSAGVALPIYYTRPFSVFPRRTLNRLIKLGVRLFPGLFGCQHVIAAKRLDD